MSQLDFFSYINQLIFFLITFILCYIYLVDFGIPKLFISLKFRYNFISFLISRANFEKLLFSKVRLNFDNLFLPMGNVFNSIFHECKSVSYYILVVSFYLTINNIRSLALRLSLFNDVE